MAYPDLPERLDAAHRALRLLLPHVRKDADAAASALARDVEAVVEVLAATGAVDDFLDKRAVRAEHGLDDALTGLEPGAMHRAIMGYYRHGGAG